MSQAFTVLPVLLVLVFVAAGSTKLGRIDLTTAALRNFRMLQEGGHPIVASLVPVAELLLGLALFSTRGWVFTVVAACAVVVTGGFTVIVARALVRGDRFDCGCFGEAVHTPISGALLIRNALLLIAAIGSTVLGTSGFDGVVPELALFTAVDVCWAAVTALTAALVFTTFRPASSHASTPRDRDDAAPQSNVLTRGDTIPDMHLDTASGFSSRILDTIAERPHMLVFVKAGCGACHKLLQQSPQMTDELGASTGMLLLVLGNSDSFEAEHPRLAPYALYGAGALAVRLGIDRYPAAALVSPDGQLLSTTASGASEIHNLASTVRHR